MLFSFYLSSSDYYREGVTNIFSEILEQAMFYENRGYLEEAGRFYSQLEAVKSQLNGEALERLAHFYYSQDKFEQALHYSKLALVKGGDISGLATIYIDCWEKRRESIEQLEWLLVQPGMDYLHGERLNIAHHLYTYGEFEKSYLVTLDLVERMEHDFRRNPSQFLLYVECTLHLIKLEFHFDNPSQCRFHLRKLMYLKPDRLAKHQEIAYWAITLDEVANLVLRKDWEQFEEHLEGDVLWVCRFYKELGKRSVNHQQLLKSIQNKVFEDERLQKKQKTYVILLQTLLQDYRTGAEEIAKQRSILPNDLLTTLLYSNYLTDAGAVKKFWKKEFLKHADRPEAMRAYNRAFERDLTPTSLSDCQVTFFGGGEKIGGTSILISVRGHHILLDAGMHLHDSNLYPDYTPLQEMGITFEDIDALLVTHAHLDHTGSVPYVAQQCPKLSIFATEATKSLMKSLLHDTVRLNKHEDCSFDLYTDEQVQRTLLSIQPVVYNTPFRIPSKELEWKVTYFPSGHILGAAAIHLVIDGVSILFTGDYSVEDQRTVKGLKLPEDLKVDLLITESTYGFLPTNASMKRVYQEKLFIETVKHTMGKNGTMLIPAFALGRAQEVVMILKEAYKEDKFLPFNVFLDGRVTEVCRIYQQFADRKEFIHPDYYQSEEDEPLFFGNGVQAAQGIYSNRRDSTYNFEDFINEYILPGNSCVIASSGMLTDQSASAKYAEYLVEEEKNAICFTGYMDEESPGSHILQQKKTMEPGKVKVNGVTKEIQASVESFRLSAHASREEILQLILELQPKQVFLMHGEHQKQYSPIESIVGGDVIYPSLLDLLKFQRSMNVIPAFNGKTYALE